MTNKETILSIVSVTLILIIVLAMTVGRPYIAEWKYFESPETILALQQFDSLNKIIARRDGTITEKEEEIEELRKKRERIIANLPDINERFEKNINDVAADDAVADFRAIDTIFSEHSIE